jgi:hypothetical protein
MPDWRAALFFDPAAACYRAATDARRASRGAQPYLTR